MSPTPVVREDEMRFLEWDTETFSKVDLKKHGVSRYMRDPSTEVILAAWSFDGGRTMRLWDRFDKSRSDDIGELHEALEDDRVTKVAWNAAFEQNVAEQLFGIKVHFDEWLDPMIMAKHCSLPGALAEVCKIIGLPEDLWKHATGKSLIRYFCQPRKPTKTNPATRNYPDDSDKSWEKWQTFREYCPQDVRVEAACLDWLWPWDMPRSEWELWYLDRKINETGIPINRATLENAITLVDQIVADRMETLNRITKLENANSTEQLLGWLQDRDYPFNDMKIGHVKRALQEAKDDGDGDTKYAKALALRADIAKASVKKFRAFEAYVTDDDRLRNMFQFNGAGRTARWSGAGPQMHNLARPLPEFEEAVAQEMLERAIRQMKRDRFEMTFGDPMGALSSGIRGQVQAPDGYMLYDADLNAIENRVLGWMADEERIIDVFLNDRCPYVDFATYMFKQPYDVLWNEYKVEKKKQKRTIAKPAVLGAGYMLSAGFEYEDEATGEILATGLLGYARGMGIAMTPEQAEMSVEVWRETYSKAADFWWDVDKAVRRTIATGKRTEAGPFEFYLDKPFLKVRLPSGRHLYYLRPKIEDRKTPWGQVRPTVTYEGIDSRSQRKVWTRISTHPGKVTENLDQAVARDILATGLKRAMFRGLDIRLHVHDQIVGVAREGEAERAAKILSECMSEPMEWAPDLPLKAEAEIHRIWVKT
jgi:DNA polymerase